jgi:hypothetical protein
MRTLATKTTMMMMSHLDGFIPPGRNNNGIWGWRNRNPFRVSFFYKVGFALPMYSKA